MATLDPWKGKFWRMWQVACNGELCQREDQVGSSVWSPTLTEAKVYFRKHGWKQRKGEWYCRGCA